MNKIYLTYIKLVETKEDFHFVSKEKKTVHTYIYIRSYIYIHIYYMYSLLAHNPMYDQPIG